MAALASTPRDVSRIFHPKLKIKASPSWEPWWPPDNQISQSDTVFIRRWMISSWIYIIIESRTSGIFSIYTVLIETYCLQRKDSCGVDAFPDLLCSCGLHSDQTTELLDSILEILSLQYDDHLISMSSCATSLKPSFTLFILIVVLFYSFAFHQIVCDDGC